jgi:hypothetical protein
MTAAPVAGADLWHLTGWTARAAVEIVRPASVKAVDCASVKVLLHGCGKPDGSDFRVVDVAGKPVPFQVTFHDPARYSLITFQCAAPKAKVYVYFGNARAARSPEQVVADDSPGAGPPKGVWAPQFGLVFETRIRPGTKDIKDEMNPDTVDEFAKLLAASPRKLGARYQPRIADGYNPFGSSDYFISVYRG